MNKKQAIQIAVIVIAFGLSGVVLYNGFFSNHSASSGSNTLLVNTPNASINTSTAASDGMSLASGGSTSLNADQLVLPYGDSLDFSSVIQKGKFQYGILTYPTISQSDIGLSLQSLFSQVTSGK